MSDHLSIITINFNNAKGLEQTFQSLSSQTFRHFELLVIDGGSTDGSLKVIEKYGTLVTNSISEKDKGIYDAQNKGIVKAKGKYLLFLNSGDFLVNDRVLENFFHFSKDQDYKIVYGDTKLLNEKGEFHHDIIQPDILNGLYFFNNTLNHQSCFIRRDLFSEYGLYKTQYRICSDFEFFLNVFLHDPKAYKHMKSFVAWYGLGGFSSDPKNYELVVKEKQEILSKYFTEKELKKFRAENRKQQTLGFNVKAWLYKNKLTYAMIRMYVKLKAAF